MDDRKSSTLQQSPPRMIARKCIVCGTTKHESHMKPFLLKGDQLCLWANTFFGIKRGKMSNFYAKLRYTLNPYACVDHFKLQHKLPPLNGVFRKPPRKCGGNVALDCEDPPTIKMIREKKTTPASSGDDRAKSEKTEEQVESTVMGILQKAREQMSQDEDTRKELRKISLQMTGVDPLGVMKMDDYANSTTPVIRRRKKRKRVRVLAAAKLAAENAKKKEKKDGNEADESNSSSGEDEVVDVIGIESEYEEATDSGSEYETEPDVNASIGTPMTQQMANLPVPLHTPPPTVLIPRNLMPLRPYCISSPSSSSGAMTNVPKRLTQAPPNKEEYRVQKWLPSQPKSSALTLASVLHKLWNEDVPGTTMAGGGDGPMYRPLIQRGRGLPPPPMKFVAAPVKEQHSIASSTSFIKHSTLMNHPPLSPSRLIIGCEEIVKTTTHSDEEVVYVSTSPSSTSDESEDESSDHSIAIVIPEGPKIEGEIVHEPVQSRSNSPVSSDADIDIDVETVDDMVSMKTKKEDVRFKGGNKWEWDRRTRTKKETESKSNPIPLNTSPLNYRIILPPSATVKPPTKLITSSLPSITDLLKAQARVASASVQISTGVSGECNTVKPLPRPKDMPRLQSEIRRIESEWSRLEKVVETKKAEHRVQTETEKKKDVDAILIAENPPPELEKVDETDEKGEAEPQIVSFPDGFIESVIENKEKGNKILRMRFIYNKKEEEVDVSKMKVLDRSTVPLGIGREEEVKTGVMRDTQVKSEKKKRGHKSGKERKKKDENSSCEKEGDNHYKKGPQVTNPKLVIAKDEVMELREKLREIANEAIRSAPPPTPIVGIPNKMELEARRKMYEKQRLESSSHANLKLRRARLAKEELLRRNMDIVGEFMNGRRDKMDDDMEDEETEQRLAAEAIEIVRIVKQTKQEKGKLSELNKREGQDNKKDKRDVLIFSDIDFSDENEEIERVPDNENVLNRKDDSDSKEDVKKEDGRMIRRKSIRLEMKSNTGRVVQTGNTVEDMCSSDSGEIQKRDVRENKVDSYESEGEEDMDPSDGIPIMIQKRKRGRPRKYPPGIIPPYKKLKGKSNLNMTEEEKNVLARVLTNDDDGDGMKTEMSDEKEEIKSGCEMSVELGEQLASATAASAAVSAVVNPVISKTKTIMSQWERELSSSGFTAGRLCQYCKKHQNRMVFIANVDLALMDHARMHCVETLMCPSANCTYMNTQRSRIAQHVSYVHKKWGMPIDLTELYPSLRGSLLLRLRQCFPDEKDASVCKICRVAVDVHPDFMRWHAQRHLPDSLFKCSRISCNLTFSSEQECLEHIRHTRCNGMVLSGMNDVMVKKVDRLVLNCFGNILNNNSPPVLVDENYGDKNEDQEKRNQLTGIEQKPMFKETTEQQE